MAPCEATSFAYWAACAGSCGVLPSGMAFSEPSRSRLCVSISVMVPSPTLATKRMSRVPPRISPVDAQPASSAAAMNTIAAVFMICSPFNALFRHEGLIRIEFRRKQFRRAFLYQDQVLHVPEVHVRLQRQHHALFQHVLALPAQDRLLLVPPAAYAVADQHVMVGPARLAVLAHGEGPQVVHVGACPATAHQ